MDASITEPAAPAETAKPTIDKAKLLLQNEYATLHDLAHQSLYHENLAQLVERVDALRVQLKNRAHWNAAAQEIRGGFSGADLKGELTAISNLGHLGRAAASLKELETLLKPMGELQKHREAMNEAVRQRIREKGGKAGELTASEKQARAALKAEMKKLHKQMRRKEKELLRHFFNAGRPVGALAFRYGVLPVSMRGFGRGWFSHWVTRKQKIFFNRPRSRIEKLRTYISGGVGRNQEYLRHTLNWRKENRRGARKLLGLNA